MRESALAALGAVLVAACTQLPVDPPGAPTEATAPAPAGAAFAIDEERRGELGTALQDARDRLLPVLEDRAGLDAALSDLDAAMAGGRAPAMAAAAHAALTALDAAAQSEDPGVVVELDAIRLMLIEVLASIDSKQ